ncbi:MAG: glucose-6-phosphate isomerase [Waddliaceae bacterium]
MTQRAQTAFDTYKATKRLHEYVQMAPNLSENGVLTEERIGLYVKESCGFKLLYATERVNEQILDALKQLATEANAIQWLNRMQAGDVINKIEGYPSESRTVLHTALRDQFENPRSETPAKEAAALQKTELEKLKAFSDSLDQERNWTDLLMIGIGGSYLGPEAAYEALSFLQKKGRRVHFVSNIDPDNLAGTLNGLNLANTLVVVVSKSGTTLETLTNETIARARFTTAGLNPNDHFIAVTGKKSPMDDPSLYRNVFYLWDFVGGRYSTCSMVGGVPLAFAFGYEAFVELLRGAHEMDQIAANHKVDENLPLLAALFGIWNRNFLGHSTLGVIPYSHPLHRFAAHLQQLDMESNGKQIDRSGHALSSQSGPIVWGEPGTCAQHSFFQLLHQGTTVVPIQFIGFKESQWKQDMKVEGTTSQEKLLANLFAQAIALAVGKKDSNPNKEFKGNRPSSILLADSLTPRSFGALLSFFENKVAFQGFIWNINSFDQEGVQLGKVLATQLISRFKDANTGEKGEKNPIGDAYLKHVRTI